MAFVQEMGILEQPTSSNKISESDFSEKQYLLSDFKVSTDKLNIKQETSPEPLQIFVLGPSNHGKRRLIECFANRQLEIPVDKDIHLAYKLNGFMLQGVDVEINLWHVGNIELSLSSLQHFYQKYRTCFMLIYDVNDFTTFQYIREWIPNLRSVLDNRVPIVLVGYDDPKQREILKLLPISYSDGVQAKAFFELIAFYEFSDVTGASASEMFFEAAHIALDRKVTTPDPE